MDNRAMNIYEIEEHGILQCSEETPVISIYGSSEFTLRGGLSDNM